MFKLLKNLKFLDWILIIVSVGLIVLQIYLDLEIPGKMSEVTNLVMLPNGSIREILLKGILMMGYAFLSLLGAFAVGFIMARVATNFSYELRSKIFDSVQNFRAEEINSFETSSLITRTTNDVNNVQMFIIMALHLLIRAPIISVWSILKISNAGHEWSIATLIAVILITILVVILMILIVPKIKVVQGITDELTNDTRENLTGVRVIRAYNAENYQEKKFNDTSNKLKDINLFAGRGMAFLNPTLNLIINILMIVVYYIGAYLVHDLIGRPLEQFTVFSNMLVFIQYAMIVIMSYLMLFMTFFILPRTLVSAKRINEVLETKPTITNGHVTESKDVGEIEFKNVSFKYPNAENYVLKDINLKIKKGERVAFIGSTGSGKSTLINLIPRFYDVESGEVLVDGINVKDYDLDTLNKKIGYVSQKATLFKATIRKNIALGFEEVDDKLVWKALEIAEGKSFIKETEEKLDYEISQSGTNLSGGQKQRISIARAVYKNPQIFIFDDSFSALDFKTDKNVRTNIKNNLTNVTQLVVAQRIGTIMDANKIIVLDNGEIVGIGTHDELIKDNVVYQEIASSQLSGGEEL